MGSEDVCNHINFSFAFNNSNFSDRILRIYIFSESTQLPSAPRSKTLHISSPILAAKSPFFYKLFSNGMRESEQCHATLRIKASEEAGLMELLKFMYSNTLTLTSALDVLDVLMAADKFNVPSCMRHCGRLLTNLPMTPEFVSVYLDLPSTILMAETFQQLTVAAKQFYSVHYKDITKFQDEILSLSLASVEAILSSDDLQVPTEDEVYSFVLKWARAQYPKVIDRRKVLETRLAKLIRFPYMTGQKLEEVLSCKEFDPIFAGKIVTEANSFESTYASDKNSNHNHWFSNHNHWFVKRAYEYQPIKLFEFTQPHPRLVVYMDLKRDACASLFPRGMFYSLGFRFGGHILCFRAEWDQQSSFHIFKLHLVIREKDQAAYFVFDYEFAARSKPSEEFVSKFKGKYACTGGKKIGSQYLFGIPWTSFNGEEDSVYFIDGVLHLRLELTFRGC